jgi:hypothetical protein
MLLLNSFSLNMVATLPTAPRFSEISVEQARKLLSSTLESGVGHADTAALFAEVLGMEVPRNRTTVALKPGDEAIIGQYRGPRLPEGAYTLPDGATIQWIKLDM